MTTIIKFFKAAFDMTIGNIFRFIFSIIKGIFNCIGRTLRRVYRFFARIFSAIFGQILGFIRWSMSILTAVFLYIGVKGFTFLVEDYYSGNDTMIPIVLHFTLEGVLCVIPILICAYFLAHKWRVTSAFLSLVAISAINGLNFWSVYLNPVANEPPFKTGGIAILAYVVGLATVVELKKYRDRSLYQKEQDVNIGIEANPVEA